MKWQVWEYQHNYYIVNTSDKILDCFVEYLTRMFVRIGGEAYLIYANNDINKCKDFLLSHYGAEGVVIDKVDKNGNLIIELEDNKDTEDKYRSLRATF